MLNIKIDIWPLYVFLKPCCHIKQLPQIWWRVEHNGTEVAEIRQADLVEEFIGNEAIVDKVELHAGLYGG